MELFGRRGYHATTVAQIEAAAGLAPGAGGLYRHFASKRAVLEAGLAEQAAAGRPLLAALDAGAPAAGDPPAADPAGARDRLLAVARAGLRRLEQERDVNRLLLRDLASFPDLLDQVRRRELVAVHAALTGWLDRERLAADPAALAAVLLAAVSHYWTLADVFGGTHPHGVDADRFLGTLADLVTAAAPPPAR